ncbi:hypothetical protein NHP21005_09400 [Helicobacter sp. NHP21005]|uniref:restriction endonuclease subunit S n=1 Tax=Helicobacter felistomachi TaxID=3040201 RepID=UPI0025738A5D|nr:restriction endonuclease subunit S [Helicobacter sp. NHP21005]BEG57252.1 hypothetical protein NHP21005_09400 [Helicobacter sp. NHP21005]
MLLAQQQALLARVKQSMLELLLGRVWRFQGDGKDWGKVELSQCTIKIKNIVWRNNNKNYAYIDLACVSRDTHDITETTTINATTAPSRAIQVIQTNDVLLGTTRPLLRRYTLIRPQYNGQICSTGFCVLRPNPSVVIPQWIYCNIASNRFFEHARVWQEGANYPMLSNKNTLTFKIPLPPLSTQEKIARLLSALEDLSVLCGHKQALLERITHALRDQLIPKEI